MDPSAPRRQRREALGDPDLDRVGTQLGARYLVAGSVRRSEERIRVSAQLIDALSGENVWAETYDRSIADLFVLQDDISSTIAASLVGDLTRAEGERARLQGTGDLEAWSLYQLGLQHSDRFTRDDSIAAARFFERSAERDPRFATALARLALEHWMTFSGDGETASPEQVADALSTARRAVELDPRDPIAHAALGAVYLSAGDPENAIDATRRAVELLCPLTRPIRLAKRPGHAVAGPARLMGHRPAVDSRETGAGTWIGSHS